MIIYGQLRFFVWGRPKSLCPCISAAAIVQAQREKEEEEETTQKPPPPPPTLSLFFLPPETHKFDLSPTWKRQQRVGGEETFEGRKKGGKLFFFFHGLCGGKGGHFHKGINGKFENMYVPTWYMKLPAAKRWNNFLRHWNSTFFKFNCALAFSTPLGTKEGEKIQYFF